MFEVCNFALIATPKTIAFQTLGCKLNFSETSMLARQFGERGYQVVPEDEPADIFVLNTCSVTDFADRKCRKAVRQALHRNPGAKVVVTGCYAQLKPDEIADIPGVDLVLGAGQKFELLKHVETLDHAVDRGWIRSGAIQEVTEFRPAFSEGGRTRAFLKVQDGCDYKCAFCTIPLARGRSRSARIDEIVAQANQLEARGVMEIVLTGVNIGDFGNGPSGRESTFLQLITALEHDTGITRYRISSIEPNLCNDSIIDFVAGSKKFMPHFHMPLQSGSNTILRRMRRRYDSELYRSRVRRIARELPHACIGVDVIVGFPGETDALFQETAEFLESLPVSYLHVFTYSERANTPAAEMDGKVPMSVRKQRSERLHALSARKKSAFYLRHLNDHREILVEASRHNGMLSGFTDNYIKVLIPEESNVRNTLRTVRLHSYNKTREAMLCG